MELALAPQRPHTSTKITFVSHVLVFGQLQEEHALPVLQGS